MDAATDKGRVLIIDDQRNMRATLAMLLRGNGYEVEAAANGREGKELGAAGAYDLVLTDLRMGELDGIDVLRAIKQAQPLTEVIVMTAYGTIESAVEAMKLGAFDYIQKPFSEQELLDLNVTNDSQGANVTTAGGTAPAIDTRRLDTQVLIKSGETVVLGGVFQRETTNSASKVPLLGDIPLLGALFRNNEKSDVKRELLIFVTPKVLQEGLAVNP